MLIDRAKDKLESLCKEIGKGALPLVVDLLDGPQVSGMCTQISGEVIPSDKPGLMAMAVRQPAGVVLGIAPWNAPVILGVRAVALPLACGNTVILKASELCPRTHHLIGETLQEAGLGDGVVNVVTNAPADAATVVEKMIAHPAVRRVNFTGSTRVGRVIAEVSARHLKPVLLELGGKAPFLVLDDADIGEAVKAAAFGAFMTKPKPLFSFGHIYRSNRKTLPLWDFACPGTCLECGIQLGNIKGD